MINPVDKAIETLDKALKTTLVSIPSNLGEAADLVYTLQQRRLAAGRLVDAMEEQEHAMEKHCLELLDKAGIESARGKLGTITRSPSTQVNVVDWPKFQAYIIKNKAWELMQKRTSITAIRERWDNKQVIPGVESVPVVSLSIKKAAKPK